MSFLPIFIVIHSFGTILGCLINLFLCHVALFHSPPIIKTYSLCLINTALTNVGACISGFLLQQRIIPSGETLFYVSYGPCATIGPQFCFDVFGALLHFHTHALWLNLFSFGYRYYVMRHREPSRFKLQLFIFLVYIPSLIQMLGMFFQEMDIPAVRELLHERFPEYELAGLTITGALDIITFAPLYTIVHMTVISTPITIGINVFRRKIIKLLVEKGVDMTTRSKNLHAQLLRTLTFQATVPLFYLIGVACYAIPQFNIWTHPFFEFSITTTFLFVPILTPLSSLFYVTPYRQYVHRLFFRKRLGMTSSVSRLQVVSVVTDL